MCIRRAKVAASLPQTPSCLLRIANGHKSPLFPHPNLHGDPRGIAPPLNASRPNSSIRPPKNAGAEPLLPPLERPDDPHTFQGESPRQRPRPNTPQPSTRRGRHFNSSLRASARATPARALPSVAWSDPPPATPAPAAPTYPNAPNLVHSGHTSPVKSGAFSRSKRSLE